MRTIETRTAELQSVHDKFLFTEPSQNVARASPSTTVYNGSAHERFLRLGLERDQAFKVLWYGERRNGNESSDDIALMNKLAYWCNADPNAVVSAFLSSPYYKQKDEAHMKKCQRPDYLLNTANNACRTVYSTAAADYERWQHQNRKRKKSYAK
jgi:putative DNA primase/helicase